MARELVECPAERAGCRVAAGQQHGDELVAEDGAVTGEGGEGVQEGVTFFGFGFGLKLGGGETEGVFDVGRYEGVYYSEPGAKGFAGEENIERSDLQHQFVVLDEGRERNVPSSGNNVLHPLHLIKRIRKLMFF